jgi:hypothetical protein
VFDQYAATQQLCQSGTEGACIWLRHAQSPEMSAQRLISNLQRNCVRTADGWEDPAPGWNAFTQRNTDKMPAFICGMAKRNRQSAISSAHTIIETPERVRWATDDQLRNSEREQFGIQMRGLAHDQAEHNIDTQVQRDIGGRTPMGYDIRAGQYDYCQNSGPCPAGVREYWGTATHPGAYGQ